MATASERAPGRRFPFAPAPVEEQRQRRGKHHDAERRTQHPDGHVDVGDGNAGPFGKDPLAKQRARQDAGHHRQQPHRRGDQPRSGPLQDCAQSSRNHHRPQVSQNVRQRVPEHRTDAHALAKKQVARELCGYQFYASRRQPDQQPAADRQYQKSQEQHGVSRPQRRGSASRRYEHVTRDQQNRVRREESQLEPRRGGRQLDCGNVQAASAGRAAGKRRPLHRTQPAAIGEDILHRSATALCASAGGSAWPSLELCHSMMNCELDQPGQLRDLQFLHQPAPVAVDGLR